MSAATLLTKNPNYGTIDNQQLNADDGDGIKQKAVENAEERLQSRGYDLERAIYEVSKAAFYTYNNYEPRLEKLMGSLAKNHKPKEVENLKIRYYLDIKNLIDQNIEKDQANDFKEFYESVDKVASLASSAESTAVVMKGKRKCMMAVSVLLPVIGWIWALLFYIYNYSQDKTELNRHNFDLSNERANLAQLKERPHFQEVLETLKKYDLDFQKIQKEIREICAEPNSAVEMAVNVEPAAVHFQRQRLPYFTKIRKHRDGYNYKVTKFLTMPDPKLRYKKKPQELPAVQSNVAKFLSAPLDEQLMNPETARPQRKEARTDSLYDRLTRSQRNSKDFDSRLATDVKVFRANHPGMAQDI